MSSIDRIPNSIGINGGEASFKQALKQDEFLAGIKDDIFHSWESKLSSKPKVFQFFVYKLVLPIAIIKLHDYAIRKIHGLVPSKEAANAEKSKLFDSIIKKWVEGNYAYTFNDHTDQGKIDDEFLLGQKRKLLQEKETKINSKLNNDENHLGITQQQKERAIEIFLNPGNHKTKLENEDHNVQVAHKHLTQMFHKHLKLEVLEPFYEGVLLKAFNQDHMAALEFLHLATEGAMDHHLDEVNEKFNSSEEYKFIEAQDCPTQVEVDLNQNKDGTVRLNKKVNLVKSDSGEVVDVMDYRLDINFKRKKVSGILTSTKASPTRTPFRFSDENSDQLPLIHRRKFKF